MWQALFGITNILAMLGWIVLAALPRKPLAHSAVLYLGVAMLCLVYAVCFALVLSGSIDPGLPAGSRAAQASFTTIEGVRAIFASDGGVVIGWTHYLAFDLFTGMWIARDADAKGFGRLVQLPFLFATFMAGPIGLLAWLIVRERASRRMSRG